jgi:hypothetical protein
MGVPGIRNRFDGVLWDTINMAAAMANTVQVMFGNTIAVNGPLVTNMKTSAQLPKGEKMEVHSIKFFPVTAVAVDAALLINNITVQFSLDNKVQTEWRAFMLAAGAGVMGLTDTNGLADPRACYVMENPIMLEEQQQFGVNLQVGPLVAGLGAVTPTVVTLDGIRQGAVA